MDPLTCAGHRRRSSPRRVRRACLVAAAL